MAEKQLLPEQITFDAKPYPYTYPPAHTALVVIDMVCAESVTTRDILMTCIATGLSTSRWLW